MKNQKGMGHITLILCIAIILAIIVGIVYITKTKVEDEKITTYETDMLLIQGKVKVLSQEATVQKNDELLQGIKLEDNLELEEIKFLLENGIISQDEADFSKYYILDKSNLDNMGLDQIDLEENYCIVNYDTYEIVYSNGVKIDGNVYYKLSEIQEQNDDNVDNEILD